jgi:hypothetical protein
VCTGLVTVTVGARDARIAADPADSAGARCKLLGQATGLAAATALAPRRERLDDLSLKVRTTGAHPAPALMGVG